MEKSHHSHNSELLTPKQKSGVVNMKDREQQVHKFQFESYSDFGNQNVIDLGESDQFKYLEPPKMPIQKQAEIASNIKPAFQNFIPGSRNGLQEEAKSSALESKPYLPITQPLNNYLTHHSSVKKSNSNNLKNEQQESPEEDIAMPLIKSGGSMVPDMKFGWKPEIRVSNPPIPLFFDFTEHNMEVYNFQENLEESDALVFQGNRPINSYKMHKQFANNSLCNGASTYRFNFPKHYEGARFADNGVFEQIFGSREAHRENEDPDDFTGMNPDCEEINKKYPVEEELKFLRFDSDFESGNLDQVIKTYPQGTYDLYLRPDTNSTGYFQWFYFKVKNRCAGTKVRFNIVNLTKRNSLYQQGMSIRILSMKKAKEQGKSWEFGGQNIKYGLSKLMKSQFQNLELSNNWCQIYFQIGWDYEFEYDDDEVYFAYSLPYTFSMVTNFIQGIMDQQDRNINEFKALKMDSGMTEAYFLSEFGITEDNFKMVELSNITTSLAGIEVPMLTITDFGSSKKVQEKKKHVIITGRVHPGESNASWVVHGIIKFLLSKDKVAQELRKNMIFKIIPMINPDGVTAGNSRCSLIGRDMNRNFAQPNQKLTPEPYYIKQLVKDILKGERNKIMAYLDIHAHSNKKSIFMYGPYFPLHSSKYLKIRAIPKLISERTDMFRFFSCKFKVEKYKENCARISIWREFGIVNCFTIEASQYGYLNRDRETVEFQPEKLQEFGQCVCKSLLEYHFIQEEDRRLKVLMAQKLKQQRKTKRLTIDQLIRGEMKIKPLPTPKWQNNDLLKDSEHGVITLNSEEREPPPDTFDSQKKVFNENPNEAMDLPEMALNNPIEERKSRTQQRSFILNDMSDDSLDCNQFPDSSSDDNSIDSQTLKTKAAGPDVFRKRGFQQSSRVSKQISDLQQKTDFLTVIEGHELFHILYNPDYKEWKQKKEENAKNEQIKKLKQKNRRLFSPLPANISDIETLIMENDHGHDDTQFEDQEAYLQKEVRTFNEVFKDIKQHIKIRDCNSKNGKRTLAASDYDEDEFQKCPDLEGDDECMKIPENLNDEHDDEINQQDREVLNNRILGLLNVFHDIASGQQPQNKQIIQKHRKIIQEICSKSLTIEKKKIMENHRQQQDQKQKAGMKSHSTEKVEGQRKGCNLMKSSSNSEFQPGQQKRSILTSNKKRRLNHYEPSKNASSSNQFGKLCYSIYNIGESPSKFQPDQKHSITNGKYMSKGGSKQYANIRFTNTLAQKSEHLNNDFNLMDQKQNNKHFLEVKFGEPVKNCLISVNSHTNLNPGNPIENQVKRQPVKAQILNQPVQIVINSHQGSNRGHQMSTYTTNLEKGSEVMNSHIRLPAKDIKFYQPAQAQQHPKSNKRIQSAHKYTSTKTTLHPHQITQIRPNAEFSTPTKLTHKMSAQGRTVVPAPKLDFIQKSQKQKQQMINNFLRSAENQQLDQSAQNYLNNSLEITINSEIDNPVQKVTIGCRESNFDSIQGPGNESWKPKFYNAVQGSREIVQTHNQCLSPPNQQDIFKPIFTHLASQAEKYYNVSNPPHPKSKTKDGTPTEMRSNLKKSSNIKPLIDPIEQKLVGINWPTEIIQLRESFKSANRNPQGLLQPSKGTLGKSMLPHDMKKHRQLRKKTEKKNKQKETSKNLKTSKNTEIIKEFLAGENLLLQSQQPFKLQNFAPSLIIKPTSKVKSQNTNQKAQKQRKKLMYQSQAVDIPASQMAHDYPKRKSVFKQMTDKKAMSSSYSQEHLFH